MSETTTAMPGAATEPVEVIDAESAAGLAEATAAMGRRPVDLAVLAMVAASHQSCGESVRVSPGAADEDATVLARLLALDASGEDTRTLVDDEERACWALERTAGGAVVVRRPPGAAPLVGIRATVPPLATELVCQLVAAGDEGWGKPFPAPARSVGAHVWSRRRRLPRPWSTTGWASTTCPGKAPRGRAGGTGWGLRRPDAPS